MFLKLREPHIFSEELADTIKKTIRTSLSPRHVPSIILQTKYIPYTISGKKVEIAVKKIIDGKTVTNQDALSNPESLDLFKNLSELQT